MVQSRKKPRMISHLIIHSPTSEGVSECSGACKQSEQCGAFKRVSDVSKQANGQAKGPVFTSGFLALLDHSALHPSHHFPPLSKFYRTEFRPVGAFDVEVAVWLL